MSTLTNDSNANATSPTRSASSPPLTNSPPTDPAPNAPFIGSSNNANDIDLATTMDPNINRDNAAASSSGSIGINGVEEMIDEGPAPPVTMTEAAAIIVAKQRKGAPGVEHDGIHDTAPTPYAEAPDVEDEAGKSIGNTSRNNHVDHDVEDGGARPFDSEEFEDRGAGKKMMTRGGDNPNNTQIIEEGKEEEKEEEYDDEEQQVDHAQDVNEEVVVNAGRPRHETVMLPPRGPPRSMLPNNNDQRSMLELEATLVPNEPVYDGVPLEPVLAWYRQEKARRFLAFGCLMFMAAIVVFSVLFSVLFSRLSGFSGPEDLSPSTGIVTVVPMPSDAPSMSLSTLPSDAPTMSFAPSTPPSKTSHPSNLPSSSFLPTSPPTNTCFGNKVELKTAVDSYIAQDCAQNENCNVARLYGYPMNSWCVGQITDMTQLFIQMSTFDEDISDWDVSSVMSMGYMFFYASAFNGDLSEWDVSSVTSMYYMFPGASAFNGDLSEWNVSSVTSMEGMFPGASAFNDDLSEWNVSSVTSMDTMFSGAFAFNQDLCAWNGTFPYDRASDIFWDSGCTFQDDPNEQQGGPFCASSCSE